RIDEIWRPGEGRADTARQRDRARHQPGPGIEPEQGGHPHAGQILQDKEAAGEGEKDREWPPAGQERAYVGLEPDPGEEDEQEEIPCIKREADLAAEDEMDQTDEDGAGKSAD